MRAEGQSSFSAHSRLRSFTFALSGLKLQLRHEHNAWIHAAATVLVVIAGSLLRVTGSDWRWLVAAAALVWMAEAFNTAIERLCDVVTLDRNEQIGVVKDVAAGGVLVCAIAAVLIGTLTLLPYVMPWRG